MIRECIRIRFARVAFFIFLAPSVARADGIMMREYSMEAVRIALLVKLLAHDPKKGEATVEIIKTWRKSLAPSSEVTPIHQPTVHPVPNGSEQSDFKVGSKVKVTLRVPRALEAKKWVDDSRYWGASDSPPKSQTMILVDGRRGFEFVEATPRKLKDLDLLFDASALAATIQKSSDKELASWLANKDFATAARTELIRRKKLTSTILFEIKEVEAFLPAAKSYVEAPSKGSSADALFELAELFSKTPRSSDMRFFALLRNQDQLSLPELARCLLLFDPKDSRVEMATRTLLHRLDQRKSEITAMPEVLDLHLRHVQTRSDQDFYRLETLFSEAPAEKRGALFMRLTRDLLERMKKSTDIDVYRFVIKRFSEDASPEAAWAVAQFDVKRIKELHESDKSTLVPVVLERLLRDDIPATDANKKKILAFSAPFTSETSYPMPLPDAVKAKLMSIGGYVYEELPSLRVEQQKNTDELLNGFRKYFEIALLVEIRMESQSDSFPTMQLKRHVQWGRLDLTKTGGNSDHVLKIVQSLESSPNVRIRTDAESLKRLKGFFGKKLILATSAKDYKFLIFSPDAAPRIEAHFKSESP